MFIIYYFDEVMLGCTLSSHCYSFNDERLHGLRLMNAFLTHCNFSLCALPLLRLGLDCGLPSERVLIGFRAEKKTLFFRWVSHEHPPLNISTSFATFVTEFER